MKSIDLKMLQPTGIDNLDEVLHGGIPHGSCVLLAGASGTGKTILSLQWLFAGYDHYQEPGIYISMTEPISKTIRNASNLSFYDQDQTGPLKVYFTDLRGIISGLDIDRQSLTDQDVDKIIDSIKRMVDESKAKRVVIDSVTAMGYRLNDKNRIRDFIFRVGTLLSQVDANIILTSEVMDTGFSVFGEEFIADGIIKLTPSIVANRRIRKLEIIKMRGSAFDTYATAFRVTKDGIIFYPQIKRELTYKASHSKVKTGILGMDDMVGGGLYKGSSTLICGPSGTGKTIMSLQFMMEGLKNNEKVLYVSFEESSDQLTKVASTFGWDLQKYLDDETLKIICSYPEELFLDEHLNKIKDILGSFEASRIIIDSLSAVGTVYGKASLPDFASRLVAQLKQAGITAMHVVASDSLLGTGSITDAHLSTLYDNILMLRFIEVNSELKHALVVLKTRGSDHDKNLREISIISDGMQIGSSFSGYEGALSGETKKVSQTIEEQFHSLLLEIVGPAGEKIFIEEKKKGLTLGVIKNLLNEFGNQGIISVRRKNEYLENFEKLIR